MIITKKQLIQEGVLDFVKNNYGKGLLGGGSILAAKAGVFGEATKAATNAGIEKTSEWLSNANNKIAAEYGDSATKALAKAKIKVNELQDKQPVDNQDVNHFQTNNLNVDSSDVVDGSAMDKLNDGLGLDQ